MTEGTPPIVAEVEIASCDCCDSKGLAMFGDDGTPLAILWADDAARLARKLRQIADHMERGDTVTASLETMPAEGQA